MVFQGGCKVDSAVRSMMCLLKWIIPPKVPVANRHAVLSHITESPIFADLCVYFQSIWDLFFIILLWNIYLNNEASFLCKDSNEEKNFKGEQNLILGWQHK